MNIEELEEALDELFPEGYSIEEDNRGRLIIHTTLVEDEEGELFSDGDEDDDEDSDPDLYALDDEDD